MAGLRALLPALLTPLAGLGAQVALADQQSKPFPEFRVDVIAGRVTDTQLGMAVSWGNGAYSRAVLGAAGGLASNGRETKPSARFDALGRFYIDPARVSRWGLYGAGGLSGLYDGFTHWRALITAAIGVELPSRANATWAAELGLGGGVRLGVALRRTRPDRR